MSKIFDYLSGRTEQKQRVMTIKPPIQSEDESLNDSDSDKSDNPDMAPDPVMVQAEASKPPSSEISAEFDADKPFSLTEETSLPLKEEDAEASGSDTPDSSETVSVAVSHPIPNSETRYTKTFSLDLADYRIKNVLDPATTVGEQFRLLRARLTLEQKRTNMKSLLVTSAAPGEGKTFTSCSLAGVLAQEPEKKVLLIDGDMRRSMAGRGLGVSETETQGLSDVLKGDISIGDALISSEDGNLFFLPAGNFPSNPSELLSSSKLEKSFKSIYQSFDWVIIDSPPVIALADTNVIAPICDAVLLVILANGTPSKLVQDSIQRIGKDKICGVIMNRVKHLKSSKYYYKYYSRGKSDQ